MTQISIAHIGSYPRTGEDKDQQRYRRGYAHFERKDISAHAFRDVEQSVIQEIVREQLLCELDEVTDGLIGWQDPISHFCKNVSGIETAGLARYFNANFYYRVPVIVAKPRLKEPVLAKEFLYAQSVSNKPIRAVVTGPVTLGVHTSATAKTYKSLATRVDFFTQLLRQELTAVLAAGARIVQIDEPSLAADPSLLPLAKKSLQALIPKTTTIKFVLGLYYAPLAPLWDSLESLPVQGLNLDFTYDSDKLFKKMTDKRGTKEIGFGLIDARNTRLEDVEIIAETVRQWIAKFPADNFTLTPSSGLEMLPRNFALQKIALLAKVRQACDSNASPSPVYG